MSDNIQFVLKPGVRPEHHIGIDDFLDVWCRLGAVAPISHRIRVSIEGGPWMSRADKLLLLRHFIPTALVEDVLVDDYGWDLVVDESNREAPSHNHLAAEI